MTSTTTPLLIGESNWALETLRQIDQAAPFQATVLISGPSGTGKELVARAIHSQGNRSDQPFLPVNCAAIPNSLFDSQMFGHTKGAFTGADYESLGCFRAAEGGTLFLDEIGELDLDLQAKLLRVLQDRQVVPVGSHAAQPIDLRIVAATNRDLEQEVAAGRFRLDLFYRLNVIEIPTLGLKDRPEDIEPLSCFMLHKACAENGLPAKSLTAAAQAVLMQHDWPGNVRELQNLMERAALASCDATIGSEDLLRLWNRKQTSLYSAVHSAEVPTGSIAETKALQQPTCDANESPDWKSLDDVEAEHIALTLAKVSTNKSAAARLLKIDRKRLDRKIAKYNLAVNRPATADSVRAIAK